MSGTLNIGAHLVAGIRHRRTDGRTNGNSLLIFFFYSVKNVECLSFPRVTIQLLGKKMCAWELHCCVFFCFYTSALTALQFPTTIHNSTKHTDVCFSPIPVLTLRLPLLHLHNSACTSRPSQTPTSNENYQVLVNGRNVRN